MRPGSLTELQGQVVAVLCSRSGRIVSFSRHRVLLSLANGQSMAMRDCSDTSLSRSGNLNASALPSMLLFASQTAPGGPSVILPALLITGLLIAASQAFVPKG